MQLLFGISDQAHREALSLLPMMDQLQLGLVVRLPEQVGRKDGPWLPLRSIVPGNVSGNRANLATE